MSSIETKLAALGLHLPAPIQLPPGVTFEFIPVVPSAQTREVVAPHLK